MNITHHRIIPGRGTVIQENHYYPFGMSMKGLELRGNPDHRFKFNGKERTEVFGVNMDDFGARHYDPARGRWDVPDLLSEDYYSISNYAFVANNPINAIDPDGKVVKPANNKALEIIKLSISTQEEKYVKINSDGFVDQKTINRGIKKLGGSENFKALAGLATSNITYNVLFSEEYKTLDDNGNTITKSFNIDGKPYRNENDQLVGFAGITLVPNPFGEEDGSSDLDVSIVVNSTLNMRDQTETFVHEAYGHAHFYDQKEKGKNINPWHSPKFELGIDEKTGEYYLYPIETNKDLEKQLNRVQYQALKYYDLKKGK